jgi:very-short-patch-repair endonuclease
MDPIAALRSLDGVARAAELDELSVPRRALQASLQSGHVIRARSGMYYLRGLDPELIAALSLGGKLGGSTVLARTGVWLMDESRAATHVWVAPTAKLREPTGRLIVHRDAAWSGDGRLEVSLLHALRHLVIACRDPDAQEQLVVAVESALNKQLIALDDLDALAHRASVQAKEVLAFATDSSQSGLESLVRWRLHRIGIPAEAQVRIEGVGVADLRVGRTLLLELNGKATHDFDADRERDTETAIRGYATLRFSQKGILRRWHRCELAVRNYISLGLHELPQLSGVT